MERLASAWWGITVVFASTAHAQVTQRVSVGSNGTESNGDSSTPSISSDLRFVAFASRATNLVPGDANAYADVYVRDRQDGTLEWVSVPVGAAPPDGHSSGPSISADGRFVAFTSIATNLVQGDDNQAHDIFVRDRQTGTTERISVDSSGAQALEYSAGASISADGRFVAFHSLASNLVPGDVGNWLDIFVRDRQTGTTERVSVDSGGAQGNADSAYPLISADGRYVAFTSLATNLVAGDTNHEQDVFVHDRQSGATERVSVDSGGIQGNSVSTLPTLSADGRCVAFSSSATNLVPGDTNGVADIFLHDRQSGTTERVSVASSGAQGDAESMGDANPGRWVSADGRYVAFPSSATNLVPGDTNGVLDVFVRDRLNATTERASVGWDGAQGTGFSVEPSISPDGRHVAFGSVASSLVPADGNAASDVFLRDRSRGTSFTSLCEPGAGGVAACPCSNPPVGPDRGCDNSATTGGATLSAAGGAYVSSDSLVFTTSDETPTALSIVMQGNGVVAGGAFYGQGVRCVGGTVIRRLFIQQAVAGSISAPDLAAGEATVSTRSAAKGDVIQSGQSRWYLVYYRDPIVLGGCAATSTFNATQTGRVTWSP